jgi:hypothetical protein
MPQGYFKHIPDINYDFRSDGKLYKAKDLFRKVSVWSNLQEGISGYSYYRITDGERPDVTSAKLYGDSTLYWTFFLVNDNLQDLNDWPKSSQTFNNFISRKYSGTVLLASTTTDIVSYNHSTNVSSKFQLGEKVTQATTGAYGYVTNVDPTNNRITLNSVVGTFTNSSVVGTDSTKSFTVTSVISESDAVHHYTDSNGLLTTSVTGNTPVSNIEYERTINEDKFLIRYVQPQYIGKVIKEFSELVRD